HLAPVGTVRVAAIDRDGAGVTSGPGGGRGRTAGMSRLLAAVAGFLVTAALAAGQAGAKEEYWAQICGRSGCKIVKDRFVAAALTSEAEEHGSKVRRSEGVPAYTVRYAVPNSGGPTG